MVPGEEGCDFLFLIFTTHIYSGGTGIYALQIAAALEAKEVIAISSSVDLCRSLGATEVINYKEQKWEDVLKGRQIDCFYDCKRHCIH